MWSFEKLFNKAVLYVQRGLDHPDHSDTETPLRLFIGLELLARSVLANVHPSLLADPKEGHNVLFACGFPSKASPISIPAKTVFNRCTVVCPNFTTREFEQCMIWANYRNEELHTGGLFLESLRPQEWMPEYFRVAEILLTALEKDLSDLVGEAYHGMAAKMIESVSAHIKGAVFAAIKENKNRFEALPAVERLKLLTDSEENWTKDWKVRVSGRKYKCPACEGVAVIRSEIVKSSSPRDDDGSLVQENLRIPISLQCLSCGLTLEGNEKLHVLSQGEQFTEVDELDPKEYYDIQFDPSEYYADDYGND